jgi:hypothetical protein
MSFNHRLIREAADGKADRVIQAMTLESRLRVDPQLRADTFVSRWQALDRQRRLLLRDHETSRAGKISDTMIGMAKSLERDPQIESILRNRRAEFKLPGKPARNLGRSLAAMVGLARARGIEIGM